MKLPPFVTAITGTDDRIAVIRTVAPALWAFAISVTLNYTGVDAAQTIADIDGPGGLDVAMVNEHGPLLLFAVLYLAGKFVPWTWIERLLLLVPVDSTTYTAPDPVDSNAAPPFPTRDDQTL